MKKYTGTATAYCGTCPKFYKRAAESAVSVSDAQQIARDRAYQELANHVEKKHRGKV